MDIAGSAVGGIFSLGVSGLNNSLAQRREELARAENYRYGEMAARNADKRTRALYEDYMTPKAQLQQIKDAGLSPSLMFAQGAGGGGMTEGAQGASAAVQPTIYGINPADAAQIGLALAQTEKVKAETKNVESNTLHQDLQNDIDELKNTQFRAEWEIINTPLYKENGENTSLYEIADNCYNYENFLSEARKAAERSGRNDISMTFNTEAGQATMRSLYQATNKFSRDIAVLSQENVDAQFYKSITEQLSKEEFAKLNAKEAVAQLRNSIEEAKLNKAQREAWNNILDRLGKNGSTTKDVVIVASLILDKALSSWKLPNGKKSITINNGGKGQ